MAEVTFKLTINATVKIRLKVTFKLTLNVTVKEMRYIISNDVGNAFKIHLRFL